MVRLCATAGATTINMQPCNPANDAQKWTFLDGAPGTTLRFDQIRLKSSNLCVSTTTPTGALGESLVLRLDSRSTSQLSVSSCDPLSTKNPTQIWEYHL